MEKRRAHPRHPRAFDACHRATRCAEASTGAFEIRFSSPCVHGGCHRVGSVGDVSTSRHAHTHTYVWVALASECFGVRYGAHVSSGFFRATWLRVSHALATARAGRASCVTTGCVRCCGEVLACGYVQWVRRLRAAAVTTVRPYRLADVCESEWWNPSLATRPMYRIKWASLLAVVCALSILASLVRYVSGASGSAGGDHRRCCGNFGVGNGTSGTNGTDGGGGAGGVGIGNNRGNGGMGIGGNGGNGGSGGGGAGGIGIGGTSIDAVNGTGGNNCCCCGSLGLRNDRELVVAVAVVVVVCNGTNGTVDMNIGSTNTGNSGSIGNDNVSIGPNGISVGPGGVSIGGPGGVSIRETRGRSCCCCCGTLGQVDGSQATICDGGYGDVDGVAVGGAGGNGGNGG
eukprot:ctg_3514.g593